MISKCVLGEGRGREVAEPGRGFGPNSGFRSQILCPAFGRAAQHRAACISTNKIGGRDLRNPITEVGASPKETLAATVSLATGMKQKLLLALLLWEQGSSGLGCPA